MLWDPVADAAGPVADPVGVPLELDSVAAEDPVARALVLLGELNKEFDREFGPPVDEVVVAEDEPEAPILSASPVP
jgi:hypothetical protein